MDARFAIALLVTGCWTAPAGTPAVTVAPTPPARPRVLVAGAATLAWNGDLLEQEPDTYAVLDARRELAPDAEVALVSCAGYFGRARVVSADEPGWWTLRFTSRASKWTPHRTCRTSETLDVFVVFPAEAVLDGERGEVDRESVFRSLPASIRNSGSIGDDDAEPSSRALRRWADLDADGTVDLVEIDGSCEVDALDEGCGLILAHDGARWRRVGRTRVP